MNTQLSAQTTFTCYLSSSTPQNLAATIEFESPALTLTVHIMRSVSRFRDLRHVVRAAWSGLSDHRMRGGSSVAVLDVM